MEKDEKNLSETFFNLLDSTQPKSNSNTSSNFASTSQVWKQNCEKGRQGTKINRMTSVKGLGNGKVKKIEDRHNSNHGRNRENNSRISKNVIRNNVRKEEVSLSTLTDVDGIENGRKDTKRNQLERRTNSDHNKRVASFKRSSEDSNLDPDWPSQSNRTDNPCRMMGYKFLESLLNHDSGFILTTLASPKSGFQELLNNRPVRPDLLMLITSVLNKIKDSEIHQLKVHVLSQVFSPEFIDDIKKFVGLICIEDKPERLKSIESFFKNILSLLEILIDLFPSMMNDRLRSVVVALNMSMKNAKELQGVTVMDCLFQQGKSIIEQIDSYIENKKQDDRRQQKAPGDKCLVPNNFRELALIPTKDDFLCAKPFLRQNVVKGSYSDVEQYLDIQFRLLREDFIAPLRTGIHDYVQKLSTPHMKHKYDNVKIYPKVQFKQSFKSRDIFGFLINFDCDKKISHNMNWEYSKRFMVGSLLLFSDDHFQTFYLATVVEREIKQLQQGNLFVAFVPGSWTPEYLFEPGVFFVMAESEVYYEAYRPVLAALKRLNESNFPMKQYIVDVDMACFPPVYVVDKSVYNISGYNVNLLDETSWPSCDKLKLNPSQHQAFKSALTNDFVVIQGPPGTGKTYLALRITEVMLKNNVSASTPIVVICYTNHALDQFLEGILKHTDNLVRIGSRSQNEILQKYNLDEIRKEKRSKKSLNMSYLYKETISEKIFLQEDIENMKKSIEEINSHRGIFNFNVLKSVIAPQLYNELLSYEDDWLLCLDSPDLFIPEEEPVEVPTKSEVLPGETVHNVIDFEVGEQFEEEVSDDENASRLADLFDDVLLEEDFSVGARSFNQVRYILEVESLKHEIRIHQIKLKNKYSLFMSTIQQENQQDKFLSIEEFYSKQDAMHRIDEMIWQVTFIEKQFIKFRDFKFDNKKFNSLQNTDSVWNMNMNERWDCFMSWIYLYSCQLKRGIQYKTNQYQDVLMKLNELKQLEDLALVHNAAVIGLTTSGAAKRRVLLENLNTKIVIVEEAAEVLEAHIVTSITKSVQHVILIGDHKQLKPKPAVYKLAKSFNMEVSLFERMLKNGLGCSVLAEQHRMRPEIASLIVPTIYPSLDNHPSTFNRARISGIDKFVFFLTHNHPEDQLPDTSSKQNKYEANFLIALCKYLLLQGYSPEDITILATYTGQVWCLRKEKRKLALNNPVWKSIRITPVDNFQGEENRIILLSLVRSNQENRIGFLSEENRVCVALSRAKEGLYIVGNMDNLTASSAIWSRIKQRLDEIGGIGESLTLRCERHPCQQLQVSTAQDFSKVPEGGCLLKCETCLECGHVCSRICHIIDRNHTEYKCYQPCQRKPCNVEGHKCPLYCWKPCEPCVIPMSRQLPCGHSAQLPCHVEPASVKCKVRVPTVLPDCKHIVQKPCHEDVEFTSCCDPCTIRLPCGHACTKFCHVNNDPDHIQYKCMKDCTKPNTRCRQNHACSKRCFEVCGDCEVRLLVRLPCGHSEKILCSQDETKVRCLKPCTKILSCGHKCVLQCWMPCDPTRCQEQVNKMGACGHTLKIKCNEDTESRKCYKKCNRLKSCGHPCTGKCHDDCSKNKCQVRVESKVIPACGHSPIQVPCHLNTSVTHPGSDEILQFCESPCRAQLLCGHVCSGVCRKCLQGRLHVPCQELCNKKLNCGHMCKAPCNVLCPPCQSKGCFSICNHSKCNKKCSKVCDHCTKRCVWQCEHEKCTKQCSEECNRRPCDKPCTFELKCGHMCVGYCGEVHPLLCRVCDAEHPVISANPQSRFVVLEDCDHVIEERQLQELVDAATRGGIVRLMECPQCSQPIVKTMRCRSLYIQFRKHLMKKNQFVFEENFRLRKVIDSHRQLMESDPTVSTTMNNLMTECCQNIKRNSQRSMELGLIGYLLQPLATRSFEVRPDLTGEDKSSLRIRLDCFTQALYPRRFHISYEDILQIELEVARILRMLECKTKYVNQTVLNWFDTSVYTWELDSTLMGNYGLQALTRISVTLKTRMASKLWFQCANQHWYVSENGEPCVTCAEEKVRQQNADQARQQNADLIRQQVPVHVVSTSRLTNDRYRSRRRYRY